MAERVAALPMGRGTDPGVRIGPLINEDAVAKADRLVLDAVARGASVRVGGGPVDGPGTFYSATVLDRVDTDAEIARTEIFGPVVAITRFATEDEAVRLANETEFGLVAYVFTRDLARGQRMIERLRTGMMGLNVGVLSNASAPFGGVKQSGIGREGGFEGIQEYLDVKYTMTPSPFP
jgi:succinate-semialdehyde dehydrogenase/glutarate-semialdehyde dehydrogenase